VQLGVAALGSVWEGCSHLPLVVLYYPVAPQQLHRFLPAGGASMGGCRGAYCEHTPAKGRAAATPCGQAVGRVQVHMGAEQQLMDAAASSAAVYAFLRQPPGDVWQNHATCIMHHTAGSLAKNSKNVSPRLALGEVSTQGPPDVRAGYCGSPAQGQPGQQYQFLFSVVTGLGQGRWWGSRRWLMQAGGLGPAASGQQQAASGKQRPCADASRQERCTRSRGGEGE